MGILASRQNAGVEEVDISTNHAYRYPPKSGNYFSSHFIMGGERFDTPQPEAYLFGENADLNFLGNKPTPFPYPAPQANEPTKTLKSLINIRKESLRFLRACEEIDDKNVKAAGDCQIEKPSTKYNIEFAFDSDVRCSITIYYFASEEVTPNAVIYTPRNPSMNSETYQYKKGANQQFSQINHWFDPALYSEEELNYSVEKEIMPIVIHCVAEEGEDPKQSHVTIAVVEKNSDSTYTLKPLKQKQFVDGLCYLLQEIYGIENKNAEYCKNSTDDEVEDNGSECVICMCDIRDTLILPCRHLCLCNSCADSLRYQANNCPICRAPFRALLQIRALRKASTVATATLNSQHTQENIPQGYEAVSLIEALNGPSNPLPAIPATVPVPSAPALALSQPITVVGSQDAMTSPTMKFPNESCGRRLFGSSASLRCHVTTEDSAAQTDCPMIPMTVMTDRRTSTPDIPLSIMLPGLDSEKLKCQQNLIQIINEIELPKVKDASPQLTEAQSLLEVGAAISRLIKSDSKIISRSTPDSLHLCERKNASDHTDDRVVSGGDDSDYYTPEDPGTTLLCCEPFCKESQGNQAVQREMKPKLNHPSFIECVSLPGTPQSQASNRSSGDSFSSTIMVGLQVHMNKTTTTCAATNETTPPVSSSSGGGCQHATNRAMPTSLPRNLDPQNKDFTLIKFVSKIVLGIIMRFWALAGAAILAILLLYWLYGGWIAFCLLCFASSGILYHAGDRLLYHPDQPPTSRLYVPSPKLFGLQYENLYIRTKDGIKINVVLIKYSTNPKKAPTVVFFHGNAGNVGHRLLNAKGFLSMGLNVLMVEYRGYGVSEGTPSEDGLYSDAEAAMDFLLARTDINHEMIIVFGRSLGGAVASHLASQSEYSKWIAALILENTFTRIPEIARVLFNVWIIKCIPNWFYKNQISLSPLKRLARFESGTHNDTWQCEKYFDTISNFLNEVSYTFQQEKDVHKTGFVTIQMPPAVI
uniref:RING-type E3 ubiquitin transferase n=1 Tax=Strigamia maritima TaxID=126957 RepID=T1J9H5_STRMM